MNQKRSLLSFLVLICCATLAVANEAVDAKYKEIGVTTLGKPAGPEKSIKGGRVRLYANGGIWSAKATGAQAVYGPTYDKYKSLGAESGKLGFPVTDVLRRSDGSMQTLFLHGYIIVDRAGAVNATVMSGATFTADGVTIKGMKGMKMSASQNEAIFLPQSGQGTTFSCECVTKKGAPGAGTCDIRTMGDVIRCAGVTCRNNCWLITR